ncbi:ADP-ribosylglycohydrolase [Peribacillus phoenicis]|uniref:ADP-ribosylglycohydrolase n=1 Tax=unclassified Peribacillus TaxID=2675266 RepID=UPI0039A0CCB7
MVDRWEDDNKIFLSLAIKKRLLPSLYGGNIGDMLGVPVPKKGKLQKVLGQQEVE